MTRVFQIIGGLLLVATATAAFAQPQPEAIYGESFQSYRTQINPTGWIDNAIGNPRPAADGLYKTWPDPLDNKSSNVVYGTKQASGSPEGRNHRIGTFSTLSTYTFSGQGRFEYRGRVIRTSSDARVGLTFFSSYPESDRYYLIGLWSETTGTELTMQLFGFGAGTPSGTVDSNTTLAPNKWYRFLIQVDDADGATKIRARFWPDGTGEPETFSIDATDAAEARLRNGRIGLWSAVRGEAYIDDLSAKSPVDHSAPVIKFFESGQPLTDGSKFNRDAVPEIRVTDDLSAVTYSATLDGAPYTSLTPVTVDGWHVLAVTASDGPRNVSRVQINFLVDKTAPVVLLQEGIDPLAAGAIFNRNVSIHAAVTDVSETPITATLDGQPYTLGTPITAEGGHSITVEATDAVGWKTTAGPVVFTVDKTAPQLTFTSHQDGAVLTSSRVVIAGGSDDALTVTVAGSAATVDVATKIYTSPTLSLLEGENVLLVTGTDRAGNVGTARLRLLVDTRAPALTINAPAADACIDTAVLQVTGLASDPRLDSVKVTIGSTTVVATVDSNGAFSAAVPVADEGKKLITVEAADRAGHSASASRTVVIDRTAPAIEIRENGDTFSGGTINRAVTIFVKATDGAAAAVATAKLDGAAYTSGTPIGSEGAHTLAVTATDCAGHTSQKSIEFAIDLQSPTMRDLVPANATTVGTLPASLSGTTDPDVTSVTIVGTTMQSVPGTNGAFSIAVPFEEGLNRFTLEAIDRAGNRGSLEYSVTVKTRAPIVEIRESGSPIANGTLYNRAVAPAIRSVDPQATIAATLNGASYTSGTPISNDGAYTLRATATDALGHIGSAEATFSIDRTGPVVDITAPAASTVQTDQVDVRGTVGDSQSATLNGQTLTLGAGGSFVVEGFPLEVGINALVVVGRDAAGNTGRDEVLVTRDDLGAGVLLTYPPDLSRTNRPSTDVIGRLLTPGKGTTVTVGTTAVDVDPTGMFRMSAYPLVEGENTITVAATAANGFRTSASVRVTGDFTPPALTILESGQPLSDGARFAERALISLQSADSGGTVINTLTIDGVPVPSAFTITAAGGHSLLAIARDLAGNETRVERTLFVGAAGGSATCSLTAFDPRDGSVILANKTELTGRSGGAVGVKANGVKAYVADGSFCVNVELPVEGPNTVTIVCTDADGNATGTAQTITLVRVTGEPSITIASPPEDFVAGQETMTVTGTVGAGVVSADVNGIPATITGSDTNVPRSFTAANVRLAPGLNMLVAHAKNAGGRIGTASRRGVYLKDAPAIAISAPSSGSVTGIPRVAVSGTFTSLDPATLVVSNLVSGQSFTPRVVRFSDTTGSFTVTEVALSSGDQTLRVSGRDRLNREASATVTGRLAAGTPGITIEQPAAHAYFGTAIDSFTVSGTFQAATGSLVDVNGVTATLSGSNYSASVKFSTLAGGITPVVARVTQPDGASASASSVVTQLAATPTVVETFPAANAVEVDTGALALVLFSQPMDGASINSAFRLEDTSGAPITGLLHLDKDVLTFAPSTLLTPGARYTMRVSTAAKNLAGTPLAVETASSFTTATTAPSTPPSVAALGSAVCGQSLTVNGTAAPGARLRLEAGTLTLSATADASGKFTFTYPLSGQSGFMVLRVRVVGSDGSVSPAAELKVRVDCNGPQVLSAAFDRTVNKLTIQFSEPIDPATATVGNGNAIVLTLDTGAIAGGTAAVAQHAVTITPAEDLTAKTFSLTVATTIKDTIGNRLVTPYSQMFAVTGTEPVAGDGSGFISGEVYDATTGRPLPGVLITIAVPSGSPISTNADARGRYLARLREGAHTIKASLAGYTSVWRQIVVPPGAGAIPIDIRLTRRGQAGIASSATLSLTHGGDTAVTKAVGLSVPAAALTPGRQVLLTSVGAQALIGLLPLGWSPIAAAEISVDSSEEATPLAGAQLTLQLPVSEITAAAQNLAAVQYDAVRDEWRVLASAVNVASDGKAVLAVPAAGAYALVYPDKAAGLTQPPLPVAGDVLRGVPAAAAAVALVKRDFQLDPPIVLPTGRTVATLRIAGSGVAFPSGTAVQAYIDEELRLADGTRLLDPPFATDLLLYRTLAGDLGVADFHLAPSTKAAEVILEVGVDHIRVFPYPGRLDRGTLIGPEGGRVPADEKVAIEIATGAVAEPLRASATSLTASDLAAIGTIAGFRVVGGFHLTLQRATEAAPVDLNGDGVPDEVAPPELFIPARATFSVDASKMPAPASQVILGELLDQTPYGRMVRLAVPMMLVDPTQTATPALRFTTKSIDRSVLPVDGVIHEGRYVVLAAEAPIAFATGTVRLGSATGRLMSDARVIAAPLGVAELSRATGIYSIPVPAKPAGPFTLVPRHTTTGDGVAFTHAAAVDADTVTRVDLALLPQPPSLGTVVVLKGEPPSQAELSATAITTNVSLTTNIRASFSPAINPASVTADSITVTDALTGKKVDGSAAADGSVAVVWTLKTGDRLQPNASYIVAISSSIRGTNGATLARGATFNFSTVTEILNSEIKREKVRITIPDENGLSRITGIAGAIPAGWQAVAVRRDRDFIVRYQATAANDGSFSFVIGDDHPDDKVTIGNTIDLHVISNIGNVAAIFALTPFTSEDGKSFVVPAGAAIRYSTPEGLTLDVPAGAFDEPTVIKMTAMKKEDFLDIEFLERENDYLGSVNIDFEGTANKPLGFEAPLPAGYDGAGKTLVIAQKGMSPVGPRLALIDLMQVRGDKIVIDHDTVPANAVLFNAKGKVVPNQTLTGSKFSKYLQMLIRGGAYTWQDIKVYGIGGSVGFAAMEGLQHNHDLIWDIYWSYYIPHIHVAERGGALLPIITGRRFTVTGFDPGTGLQAASRTYDPIPFGEPGTVTPIPSTEQNFGGPYPVYGGPFRVEVLDLEVEEVDIESIRNFKVRLANGNVTVSPGASPLDGDIKVTLINASKGQKIEGTAGGGLTLPAEPGHRIALLIEERRVDSKSPLSIVFSEPIFTGLSSDPAAIDSYLYNLFKVEYAPASGGFSNITPYIRFKVDSGKRRVNFILPNAFQSEARYRVTLQPQIADVVNDAPGLSLAVGSVDVNGQRVPVGGGFPLELYFDIRKPAGELQSFSVPNGLIRGMELAGNVLFVAAQDGGLRSFDVSNPAGTMPALGYLPGPPEGASGHLAVTVDRHNRVYATAQQPASGAFRSYRVEDFVNGGTNIPVKGSKLINWKIGFSQGLGLPSNTLLSDIPESIPFRIKVILDDDEQYFEDRKAFVDGTGAGETGNYPTHDLKKYTVTLGGGSPYEIQRVTVENMTLDMRWSADGAGGAATIQNIVARSTDRLRVVKNLRTYAIVAHLGYGIAVYDANAIEHNRYKGYYTGHPNRLREQLVLTNGLIDRECPNPTPDFGIIENYITTDAELGNELDGSLYSYSVATFHGVLDLKLDLPSNDAMGTRDDTCEQRPSPNTGGLLLQTRPSSAAVPRMQAIRSAITAAAGREPIGHFGALARYHWSITAADNKYGTRGFAKGKSGQRDYLLVAGAEYGLIVVEVESRAAHIPRWPLTDAHIADVIWIPGGVHTVRAYPSANVAVVGDRYGRAIIIDLSRIDERWDADNQPFPSGVFPTVAKALQGVPDGYGIGADDPRILWKSAPGMTMGAAAPVFDPNTGMIFGAKIAQVKAFAGIDPKIEMKVNLGETGGMSTVGGVVPLGVPLPKNIEKFITGLPGCDGTTLACKENASLAAFKLEVSLPGDMVNSLTNSQNELRLAVESERIIDAVTEQTPDGFPKAHLRRTRRNGSSEAGGRAASSFKFTRVVPDELRPVLKTQRGFNRFISPWIVAIADPRAAEDYVWREASTKQEKKDKGCDECERPEHLKDKGESDGVYELWTNGRYIAVRPELTGGDNTIFEGTQYSYLGQEKRMLGRFTTTMADTVRPTDVVVAGQNEPVARGALQETTYVHSGEVQSVALDLNAGGRAGLNVTYDRAYRSRTLGGAVFGQGWDSSMLRRLRALPNGDVEYRDGAEVWRFRQNAATGYDSPRGLYLKLSRTSRGWTITDQSWQIAEFDDMGRLLSEADEFFSPQVPGSGNIIRYLYDAQGRLSMILDPVKRETKITYWNEGQSGGGAYPGMIREIKDWRDRKVEYEYDANAGTLLKVKLPEVANISGGRPVLEYTYTPQGGNYSDTLELRTNLESIKDPHEVLAGGPARVKFNYNTGGDFRRDRVVSQQWGTGESVSFEYPSKVSTNVTDALGQAREYAMAAEPPKNYFADRPHIQSLSEKSVRVSSTPFGQLPQSITAGAVPTTSADRSTTYSYGREGELLSATLSGVRSVSHSYLDVRPMAPGLISTGSSVTSLAGPSAAVTRSISYQSGANRSTFPKSISANGLTIEVPEPSRSYRNTSASNDEISSNDNFDSNGLQTQSASSGGTDVGSGGANVQATWGDENAAKHVRGMLLSVDSGGLKTSISYPSATQMVENAPRGVTRTITFDAWDRTVGLTMTGPQLTVMEQYEYDASGRLRKKVKQEAGKSVIETFTYDVLNRPTSHSIDNVAGGGTAVTRTVYDLSGRTIATTYPSGAVSTTTLDSLGRATSVETTTGSGSSLKDIFAYDLLGNRVHTSDGFDASAKAFDANGRLVGLMGLDGVKIRATVDGWGRVTGFLKEDASGKTIAESALEFTPNGRLKSVSRKRDGGTRTTTFAWDGGGRATGISVAGRALRTTYDQAGRIQSRQEGAGSATSVSTAFRSAEMSGHSGALPQSGTSREKGGGSYSFSLEYNTLGDSVRQNLGGLEWNRSVDQGGNVTSFSAPGRGTSSFQYDSRHAVVSEGLPDGATNTYGYHPSGALAAYTDPSTEVTETINDLAGRPTLRKYKDGTTEKVEWEGRRVKSITDRQGRSQSFTYNARGQLSEVKDSDGSLLERIEYDDAGRVVKRSNADAVIEYSDFDTEGKPRSTTQSRLRGTSLLDKYTQAHTWNEQGERSSWTMPSYSGFSTFAPWTTRVTKQYDAMGNVTRIERTIGGGQPALFLEADYRDTARPNFRKVTTANTLLSREYGYDAGNGMLNRMALMANGKTIAGSEVEFEGVQRVRALLLGLSGGSRSNQWIYDARSRLQGSSIGREADGSPQTEDVSPGDFRAALKRPPGTTPADPTTIEYVEDTRGGHKISVMKRGLVVEQFAFNGGERISDGRFKYEYDAKGRLKTVTENKDATTLRRVRYFYDPRGRMVGRRAEYAVTALGAPPHENDWKLEDRPDILGADALPADTTFVWDPMSDQLVALFKAGSSEAVNPENGGLLRQIIHGGLGYDDPLEVATADATAANGVSRLYPIYDEAGGRSLQVVLNDRGEIVARSLAAGPYGEDQAVLAGPAVDKVKVVARKSDDGRIASIDVILRSTEDIAAQTVESGFRLAAVDSNGGVVRTASATPVLDGSASIRWRLTADEWEALSASGGAALSVATKSSARGAAWSNATPFMAAPKWAVETRSVFASADIPFDVRESLAGLSQWLASIPAGKEQSSTLYEVADLYAVAAPRMAEGTAIFSGGDPIRLIVSSPFHAHPFQDPFTGQNYVRARWFDLHSGAWLTPDPSGYVDSSNLYTYAGGDPVNLIDSTGLNGQPGDEEEESRVWRFLKWVAKEAVATAVEELTPVGIANGIVTAITGYDAVRGEEVDGFFARTLALASAIPGVPSAIRKVADIADDAADVGRVARSVPPSGLDDAARATPNPAARRADDVSTDGPAPPTRRADDVAGARSPRALLMPAPQPRALLPPAPQPRALLPARAESLLPDEAFHYTSPGAAQSIAREGLRPGRVSGVSYVTPTGGMSPLQAVVELALPPNRPLPTGVVRIDLAAMRRAGYTIPDVKRVSNTVTGDYGRVYQMPGGGWEMVFRSPIPAEFITVVK